jgi:phosphohistidine swiveling domain-containing protein
MNTSFLSDYLRDGLRAVLIKNGQTDKLLDYFTILGSSEKQSEIQQEELARLNLLLEITDKDILNDIEDKNIANLLESSVHGRLQIHLKDFGWLTYGYIGPVMNLEHLIDALADNLRQGDIAEQKNKIVSHYQDLKKNKEEIYGLIDIPDDLKRLFEISAELMFIKDYRKGIYQKSYVAMDKLMSEIAKRLDISLREAKFLIAEEVRTALLEDKKELYREIAQKRSLQSCYLMTDGKMDIYEGEAVEAMIKKMLPAKEDSVEDITELSGMVAYKGELTGIAKIVLTVEDIDKVEAGDILISSATNPDLIIAMKKAAAFVTDMGGITSHAAIVARELKKPCLVGTKIATHVFKDGDKIHLDAINGLVRKL